MPSASKALDSTHNLGRLQLLAGSTSDFTRTQQQLYYTICPSLVHLNLRSSVEPQVSVLAASAAICATHSFQKLIINGALSEEYLVHLGHMKKLRTLEIRRHFQGLSRLSRESNKCFLCKLSGNMRQLRRLDMVTKA
jgi:hypothetical protein